ncbi:hypothetical protein NPIL_277751, partial [Nephila pilipes]
MRTDQWLALKFLMESISYPYSNEQLSSATTGDFRPSNGNGIETE